MATVQQTLQQIQENIQEAYPAPEAGAIAQLVVEEVLQKSRMQVRLNLQEELEEQQVQRVAGIIERLKKQEPVQYVLGKAHFYDLELLVDERVLIPRPETEELVHLVIQEHRGLRHLQVLDICTGSGCIPLALAANLQGADVFALEVSTGALEVAKANAKKYGFPITWLQQDVFQNIASIAPQSLDIITSNPPYVLEEERELMRPNVLLYEPSLALFVPDTDPLKFYRRITVLGKELLREGGKLYFEINERYGEAVQKCLTEAGFRQAEIVRDLFGKDRIVKAVR